MKQVIFIVMITAFMASFGCRSVKKFQTAVIKQDTTQAVVHDAKADSLKVLQDVLRAQKSRRIDFKTFSAKIKVDYTDKNGRGPELTVFVRMLKDSAIWLSINATVFSYEAFRVLITRDSLKVLNKKDKKVQLRSVSYLENLIQLPFNFTALQDLLIGNPVYLDSNIISYAMNEASITLLSRGEVFRNFMTLNRNDYTLAHSKLDDVSVAHNRTCDLTYSDYENKNGVLFSTGRNISVSEKSKLDVNLDIKQYGFNETLSLPFTIPKNYKRN